LRQLTRETGVAELSQTVLDGGSTMIDPRDPSTLEDVAAATSSMLAQLIQPLIDHPDQCSVDIVQRGDSATFVIQVAPDDMDKFIGRNLRTGRSLQVLAGAVGMRAQRKFSLTFRENADSAAT
jgi:predicted RNA-binding protein YlqC (UPF0109 family)